jgi:hypothetical protein
MDEALLVRVFCVGLIVGASIGALALIILRAERRAKGWEEADRLREELRVTDQLLSERQKLLDAIPPCPEHGGCLPHALDWIARARLAMDDSPTEARYLLATMPGEGERQDPCAY